MNNLAKYTMLPIRLTSQVIVIDLGYEKIVKGLRKSRYTHVGFPRTGKTRGRASYAKVIDKAYKNEFGVGKSNPERSFLRSGIDENELRLWSSMWRSVRKITGGQSTIYNEATQLGAIVEVLLKDKVQKGGTPYVSNSRGTVRRKGRNQPLIDTGQMQDTIQHRETSYMKRSA